MDPQKQNNQNMDINNLTVQNLKSDIKGKNVPGPSPAPVSPPPVDLKTSPPKNQVPPMSSVPQSPPPLTPSPQSPPNQMPPSQNQPSNIQPRPKGPELKPPNQPTSLPGQQASQQPLTNQMPGQPTSQKPKKKSKLIPALLLILFLIISGIGAYAYYLRQQNPDKNPFSVMYEKFQSLLGISDEDAEEENKVTTTQDQSSTSAGSEVAPNNKELSGTQKLIPSTYGYYLNLDKGSLDEEGTLYNKQRKIILQSLINETTLESYQFNLDENFTWNKNQLFFLPEAEEKPLPGQTSKDYLVALSVDDRPQAESFLQSLANNENLNFSKSSEQEIEIINFKNDQDQNLQFIFYQDYLMFSFSESVIANTINLSNQDTESSQNNELDQINTLTKTKLSLSQTLKNSLAQENPATINFKENSISVNSQMINWETLEDLYLYFFMESSTISYTIAIPNLSDNYQDHLSDWEKESFNYLSDLFPNISLTQEPIYKSSVYKDWQKKYALLQESGASEPASLDYAIIDKILFVSTSKSAFENVVSTYLE